MGDRLGRPARPRLGLTRVVDPGHGAPAVRLPAYALRLPEGPAGRPRYAFLGHPDLSRVHPPWTFSERMGEGYFAQAGEFRLTLLARTPRPFVTVVTVLVERRATG
jgi:hypothetical protein